MLVIGIDAALNEIGVAVSLDGQRLCEVSVPARDDTLPRLLPVIDYAVSNAHVAIRDVDLFSVTVGPGSWTSLRVAVTTVKSLADTLQKRVFGVSTLDALAYNVRWTQRAVCTVVDARQGRAYLCDYSCADAFPRAISDPRLIATDDLLSAIPESALLVGELNDLTADVRSALSFAPSSLNRIRPSFVAEAGWRAAQRGEATEPHSLVPDYIQGPSVGLRSRAYRR